MLDDIIWVSFTFSYSGEYFSTTSGNDAKVAWVANDRVWFAGASLPISKHAHIVPLKRIIKQGDPEIFKHLVLICINWTTRCRHVLSIRVDYEPVVTPVALVKAKVSHFTGAWFCQLGSPIRSHFYDEFWVPLFFSSVKRSATYSNLNWRHVFYLNNKLQ